MAKLFECTYRDRFTFFERYFDTVRGKSIKKQINIPYEWYEPSSNGKYSYILDESIKLDKKQGNAKQGRDQYGFLDPMYRNIRDTYWESKTDNKYNDNPRCFYMDIETRVGTNSTGFPVPEKALEPISLIQIYDTVEDTMFVLGLKEWKHQSEYKFDYPVKYIKCENEVQLLELYLKLFKNLDPLIIYAWNGSNFDFPYLYNRIKNVGLDTNLLSNYGNTKLTESEYQGKKEFKFRTDGHFYVDLMEVYKKFTFDPVASYSLEYIATKELKKTKVTHSEYAAFDDFYTGKYIIPLNPTEDQLNSKIYKAAIKGDLDEVKELAHSEFVYYGIVDSFLVKQIDDKLNFTSLMIMISAKMGVQIGDALGTVKPWSQFIANKSMKNMAVLPPKQEHDQPHIVGGHVREMERGLWHWLIGIDVNSMYPLLGMVGFNMSPETFVAKGDLPDELRDIILSYYMGQDEGERFDIPDDVKNSCISSLKKHNLSLAINGAVFDCSKEGIVPKMIKDIYKTRKAAKKKQFQYEQKKILIGELLNELN